MVEQQPSKLNTRVRFPSPAPIILFLQPAVGRPICFGPSFLVFEGTLPMRYSFFLLLFFAPFLSACAPGVQDQRPVRVRVADAFMIGKDLSKIRDVKILDVTTSKPAFCVLANETNFVGLSGDVPRYYFDGETLRGTTTVTEIPSSDAIGAFLLLVRCPLARDKYGPFPEYEALKKQLGR